MASTARGPGTAAKRAATPPAWAAATAGAAAAGPAATPDPAEPPAPAARWPEAAARKAAIQAALTAAGLDRGVLIGSSAHRLIGSSTHPLIGSPAHRLVGAAALRRAASGSDDQDDEAAREDRRPRARFRRGRRGPRPELRGGEIDGVRPLVHGHGAGALAGGSLGGHRPAIRRLLAHDGERTVAAGGEAEAGARIEAVGIDSLADRQPGHHPPAGAIDDQRGLVAAADDQPLMRDVDRQARGLLAAGERPALDHRQLGGVDGHQLVLVLDVDEDRALAVAGGELRLAAERDGGGHLPGSRIVDRRAAAAAVEGEDPVRRGIVEDGVGVLTGGLELGEDLEALEVEHRHLVGAPVADER